MYMFIVFMTIQIDRAKRESEESRILAYRTLTHFTLFENVFKHSNASVFLWKDTSMHVGCLNINRVK